MHMNGNAPNALVTTENGRQFGNGELSQPHASAAEIFFKDLPGDSFPAVGTHSDFLLVRHGINRLCLIFKG